MVSPFRNPSGSTARGMKSAGWVSRMLSQRGTSSEWEISGRRQDRHGEPEPKSDVWTYELQFESAKQLTFGFGFHGVPIWSPDVTRLVYGPNPQFHFDLYMKNSDGTQEEKRIVQDDWTNFRPIGPETESTSFIIEPQTCGL